MEEEEDEGEEGESEGNKRRRLTEEAIMKRRQKRLWEEERKRIVFEYTQFSYYGRSVSLEFIFSIWMFHWLLNLSVTILIFNIPHNTTGSWNVLIRLRRS